QGLVEFEQVRPSTAERHYLEALRVAEQHVGPNSVAAALPASLMAQIRCDQGRFDEAEDLVIDRIPIIDAAGMLECVLRAYLVLARIAQRRTNIERAHALLEQAEKLGRVRGWGRLVAAALLERLRLYGADSRITEASACLVRLEQLAVDYPAPTRCAWSDVHDHAALASAHFASVQGRFQDRIAILKVLHQEAVAAQRHYVALRLATQLAVALLGANQPVEASNMFRGALAVAAQADISGPILDGGPEVLTLLLRMRENVEHQGNRVKVLRGDQACEKVVIPRGNLSPAAQGVLTGSLPEQVVGHVFKGGEISRGMIGPDAALVIAEDHIHDPVQAVLDGPVAAHDRPEEVRQHDQ